MILITWKGMILLGVMYSFSFIFFSQIYFLTFLLNSLVTFYHNVLIAKRIFHSLCPLHSGAHPSSAMRIEWTNERILYFLLRYFNGNIDLIRNPICFNIYIVIGFFGSISDLSETCWEHLYFDFRLVLKLVEWLTDCSEIRFGRDSEQKGLFSCTSWLIPPNSSEIQLVL